MLSALSDRIVQDFRAMAQDRKQYYTSMVNAGRYEEQFQNLVKVPLVQIQWDQVEAIAKQRDVAIDQARGYEQSAKQKADTIAQNTLQYMQAGGGIIPLAERLFPNNPIQQIQYANDMLLTVYSPMRK